MKMETPKFNFMQLNKTEQKIYSAMTDSEKLNFEKTWVQLEACKLKLMQQKNASQERAAREKKVLAEKERKERTHRLIERGAILESYIVNPFEYSNEDIKILLDRLFSSDNARWQMEQLRCRHNDSSIGSDFTSY